MKKITLLTLLALASLQCRKNDPEPLPEIASLAGKWETVAYTRDYGDSVITTAATGESKSVLEVRYDGVLLNGKGYRPCCLPQRYTFGGKVIVPNPQSPASDDPACALVDCIPCTELKLTQIKPDSLISSCGEFSTSLVRIP